MNRVRWRWEEKDFGFRFNSGAGRKKSEYYQATNPGEFYVVPASQRKLSRERLEELAASAEVPASPRVVPSPWRDYNREWDWISTADGILLNFAGCLDQEVIDRREDEGVQRAMELVMRLVEKPEPGPITIPTIQELHAELLGAIYPFAGAWRRVDLHKGEGATKWPFPPCGIQPIMDVFARDVLARTPFLSADDRAVFEFTSELMNEFLAIHPFREGNGRTAFILGNLLLMHNDLLPLNFYDRRKDQERYFSACESGRLHKEYGPLADLIGEWEEDAFVRWEADHG
jgi:cell filamentation protein